PAELARAYFELRGAQEQLAVARRNADNQRRTFELTRQRLDAGRGSAFDTERAQAQLSSTLASIPAREAQVAAAQYRVGTLVGRSPSEVARELGRARKTRARSTVASCSPRWKTWRRASPGIARPDSRWKGSRRRVPRASARPSWRGCGSAKGSPIFFRCWMPSGPSSRRRIGWPRGASTRRRRTRRCTRRGGEGEAAGCAARPPLQSRTETLDNTYREEGAARGGTVALQVVLADDHP